MGRFFVIRWVGRWLLCGGNFFGVVKWRFCWGFGKNGVWMWCFCGQDVVDWVGKVGFGISVFGGDFFAGILWKSRNSFGLKKNKQLQEQKR
jgi:hypothetical protein